MYLTISYVLTGLIILLTFVYYYLTWNYRYWQKRGIPCIDGVVPGVGNFWEYFIRKQSLNTLLESFHDQTRGHSMVGLYSGRTPTLLIRDANLVKTVLETNFMNFNANMFQVNPKLDPILAMNPFFSKTSLWKALRNQLSAAFSSGRLKCMFTSIQNTCVKLCKYLNEKLKKKGGVVELELKELFSRYTVEVVANEAFGMEDNSLQGEEEGSFLQIGKCIFERSNMGKVTHPISFLMPFVGTLLGEQFIPKIVDQFFRDATSKALKNRVESGITRNDFLQLMLELEKSSKTKDTVDTIFNEYTIASHAASFFVDGFETSKVTLSYMCYQLAMYPEIQQKVREEVNVVLSKHESLTYEALRDMTYMDKVLNESMRMYPAAGSLYKICTKEFNLEGPDGLSCRVEPGTIVMISTIGLSKDPDHWPDPEKFDPERFSEESKRERHKFSFLPFGGGPRICIGMRMAIMQMKAAVATIVKNYSLEQSPRTQLPLKFDVFHILSVPQDGLWVYVKPI